MESLTTCPCCLRKFNTEEFSPLLLHCGDTCCKSCIEKLTPQMGALRCPLCDNLDYREVSDMKKNIILLEILQETPGNCLAPCIRHSDTESLYYCMSHSEPFCFRCLADHKACDFYDISDYFISLNTQEVLSEIKDKVNSCLDSLKENKNQMNLVISQIEHKRLQARSTIDHAFNEIQETLASKKKELTQLWDFPLIMQLKEIRHSQSELDKMIAKTESDLSEIMNISISASRVAGFEKLNFLRRLECYSSYETPSVPIPEGSHLDIDLDTSTILSEINSLSVNHEPLTEEKSEIGMLQLVNYLAKSFCLSDRMLKTLETTDRKEFVPIGKPAYQDSPQKIGFNTVISSPTTHAQTLSILDPFLKDGCKVLDLACGSGYLTLCIAKSIGSGFVYGVDHIEEVINQASENILKSWSLERIQLVVADARLGLPDFAPFDLIHLGAACCQIPELLIEQLRPGGILLAPIGPPNAFQRLKIVKKNLDASLTIEDCGRTSCSSLTDPDKQCPQSIGYQ